MYISMSQLVQVNDPRNRSLYWYGLDMTPDGELDELKGRTKVAEGL